MPSTVHSEALHPDCRVVGETARPFAAPQAISQPLSGCYARVYVVLLRYLLLRCVSARRRQDGPVLLSDDIDSSLRDIGQCSPLSFERITDTLKSS